MFEPVYTGGNMDDAIFHETLKINLSSKQYVQILDLLLASAVEVVLTTTKIGWQMLADLLAQCFNDKRRRISPVAKAKLTAALFQTLTMSDLPTKVRFKRVWGLQLERSIWQALLDDFLKLVASYQEAEERFLRGSVTAQLRASIKMSLIEKRLSTSRSVLGAVIRWVKTYYSLYIRFKNMIAEKYTKLAFSESNRLKAETRQFVDARELFSNNMIAVEKAIAKFNPNQGTMTNYVQRWFQHARNSPSHGHQYGIVFPLPPAQKRKIARANAASSAEDTTNYSNRAFVAHQSLKQAQATQAPVAEAAGSSGSALPYNFSTLIDEKIMTISDDRVADEFSAVITKDPRLLRCLRYVPGTGLSMLALAIPITLLDEELTKLGCDKS